MAGTETKLTEVQTPLDPSSFSEHGVVCYGGSASPRSAKDLIAVEAPLEIRVSGERLATTMRTPGHDDELALGLLFSEGVIKERGDVEPVVQRGARLHNGPMDSRESSVVEVRAAAGRRLVRDVVSVRRGTLTTSACGVCARGTIADLLERCGPVAAGAVWTPKVVARLPEALRAEQRCFELTGGLHAAALARLDGSVLCAREDVGRHNAVDKVIGRLLLDGFLPATDHALVVSGRSSFEIVQKAAAAGVALVASVSAPSSLAIDTANSANITLVGFLRGRAFNVYTHPERIAGDE